MQLFWLMPLFLLSSSVCLFTCDAPNQYSCLSDEDLYKLLVCVDAIDFAQKRERCLNRNLYFTAPCLIYGQLKVIKKMLKRNGLGVPEVFDVRWFNQVKSALSNMIDEATIDIKDLDKAMVFKALFAYAVRDEETMRGYSDSFYANRVKSSLLFGFVDTCPMHVDLRGDELDARAYNKANGIGAAHMAIRTLREMQSSSPDERN